MTVTIILFTNLLISTLYAADPVKGLVQDDRTRHFPKQHIKVENMPARHNLWVFVLAGQSNMAGRGLVEPGDTLPDPRILTLGKNNEWMLAKEPLHFYEPSLTGLDCGLSFGRELLRYIPDSVSIAVIPCAVGGSSIDQWLGDSVHRSVPLLSNVRNRVDFAKQYGTVKGVLWHQGESDASGTLIPAYEQKLIELISVFRQIVGQDDLPLFIGELGAFAVSEKQGKWDSLNKIMHKVASRDDNTFVIGTEDLDTKGDGVHFNSEGQRLMGWRFARMFAGYYVDGRYRYRRKTTGNICTVEKYLHIPAPNPNTATTSTIQYIGEGLKRRERRANISSSDWTDRESCRSSARRLSGCSRFVPP